MSRGIGSYRSVHAGCEHHGVRSSRYRAERNVAQMVAGHPFVGMCADHATDDQAEEGAPDRRHSHSYFTKGLGSWIACGLHYRIAEARPSDGTHRHTKDDMPGLMRCHRIVGNGQIADIIAID